MRGTLVGDRWMQLFAVLPPKQRLVAVHVMVACSIEGALVATQREIALHLKLSRSIVQEALSAMVEAGLLVVDQAHKDQALMRADELAIGVCHGTVGAPVDTRKSKRQQVGRNPSSYGDDARTTAILPATERQHQRQQISVAGEVDERQHQRQQESPSSCETTSSGSFTEDPSRDQKVTRLHTASSEKQGYLFPDSPPLPAIAPTDPRTEGPAPESNLRTPTGGRAKTRRRELPPQALASADLLKNEILRAQPGHQIRNRVPWEENALRHSWARDFDVLVRVDGRAWVDVSALILWVWQEQTGSYRFEVESPDALRKKWDKIVRAMGRPVQGPDPRDEIASSAAPRREAKREERVEVGEPIRRW